MKIPLTLARHRRNFHRAAKTPTESIRDWYRRLAHLAQPCRFGNDLNKFLLEMFVSGLDDPLFDLVVSESNNRDLTFDEVIRVISEYEATAFANDKTKKLHVPAVAAMVANGRPKAVFGDAIDVSECDNWTRDEANEQVCFAFVHRSRF